MDIVIDIAFSIVTTLTILINITTNLIGVLIAISGVSQKDFSIPIFYFDSNQNKIVENKIQTKQKVSTNSQNTKKNIRNVPYLSQFNDITSPVWQKRGCGIASVAMIIEYYKSHSVSVDALLNNGIKDGGYIDKIGWKHNTLVKLSRKYNLDGLAYDFSNKSKENAFSEFKKDLTRGPLIASVHYTFDPKNIIPHLVVITDIKGNTLYYNDPALGKGHLSKEKFINSWKKRYIKIYPTS